MNGIDTRIKDKQTSCQSIPIHLQEQLVILTQHDLPLFDMLSLPEPQEFTTVPFKASICPLSFVSLGRPV